MMTIPLLALFVGGSVGGAATFREDEIECEETIAKLTQCCSDADFRQVSCDYVDACHSTTETDLSPDESRCIRELSCSEIVERGVCGAVIERASTPQIEAGSVCP